MQDLLESLQLQQHIKTFYIIDILFVNNYEENRTHNFTIIKTEDLSLTLK